MLFHVYSWLPLGPAFEQTWALCSVSGRSCVFTGLTHCPSHRAHSPGPLCLYHHRFHFYWPQPQNTATPLDTLPQPQVRWLDTLWAAPCRFMARQLPTQPAACFPVATLPMAWPSLAACAPSLWSALSLPLLLQSLVGFCHPSLTASYATAGAAQSSSSAYNYYIFFLDWHLIIMWYPSLSLVTVSLK